MPQMATNGDGPARRDQTSDLQLLVHSAPSLIHTSRPDGYLDFFNETWLTYIGRPLEDLQGWKWTAADTTPSALATMKGLVAIRMTTSAAVASALLRSVPANDNDTEVGTTDASPKSSPGKARQHPGASRFLTR